MENKHKLSPIPSTHWTTKALTLYNDSFQERFLAIFIKNTVTEKFELANDFEALFSQLEGFDIELECKKNKVSLVSLLVTGSVMVVNWKGVSDYEIIFDDNTHWAGRTLYYAPTVPTSHLNKGLMLCDTLGKTYKQTPTHRYVTEETLESADTSLVNKMMVSVANPNYPIGPEMIEKPEYIVTKTIKDATVTYTVQNFVKAKALAVILGSIRSKKSLENLNLRDYEVEVVTEVPEDLKFYAGGLFPYDAFESNCSNCVSLSAELEQARKTIEAHLTVINNYMEENARLRRKVALLEEDNKNLIHDNELLIKVTKEVSDA